MNYTSVNFLRLYELTRINLVCIFKLKKNKRKKGKYSMLLMQSASCQMPGWMKHELESRLPEEISITSDMQMTPP